VLSLADSAGLSIGFGHFDMKRLLLFVPAFVALMVITLAHAQQDITPPSLLDVRFEPETIDTSKGPVTITVTVHVTVNQEPHSKRVLISVHLKDLECCCQGIFLMALTPRR
jgi:hypothetical protein